MAEPHLAIVIGRQYGSGGRRVGKLIAQKLGITYYDSELLSAAAERLGFSNQIFAAHDEKQPMSVRSLLQAAIGVGDGFYEPGISGYRIYAEQSKVIREIYNNGSSVIVGRTADYILRDEPGMVSIFLHSPLEVRARNILMRGDAANIKEAKAKARKFDKERANYYNFYIGKNLWGKAENYSLCIDSSQLDIESLAELVIEFAKKKIQRRGLSPA